VKIIEIVPKEDCMLYIKMEDGRTGFFDVKPYLASEAFAPLRDRQAFKHVHNGGYYIEWACGADLSADTIEVKWQPGAIKSA